MIETYQRRKANMKKKTYREVDFATALYEQTHKGAVVEIAYRGRKDFTPSFLPLKDWNGPACERDKVHTFAIVTESEPKFRPWRTVDEVPVGAIVRDRRNGTRKCIQSASMGGGTSSALLQINGAATETFCETHTMDNGSPCGVEVVE
jgi:hypothetical protein